MFLENIKAAAKMGFQNLALLVLKSAAGAEDEKVSVQT
jgi:hypothetical protein